MISLFTAFVGATAVLFIAYRHLRDRSFESLNIGDKVLVIGALILWLGTVTVFLIVLFG